MKKTIIIIILTFATSISFAQISKETIAQQQPLTLKGNHLLKTDWDQWGAYAKYTPENKVLGCWSIALAQILFYHQLQPMGEVNYLCSKGYRISDTLSKYNFVWKDFKQTINKQNTDEEINPVARYAYLTAIAIKKDFGTEKYFEMVNPAPMITKHFDCVAAFYGCFNGDLPFPKNQLTAIAQKEQIKHIIEQDSVRILIQNEIKQKRPVYFHMGNFTTYGHSTVIDGYKEHAGVFYVHLNYGASGFRTGWYNLFKPIDVLDDIKLRAFVTIIPNTRKLAKL